MKSIKQRLAALEALPAPNLLTSHTPRMPLQDRAAHFGMSEADVVAKFGGWPGFAHAVLVKGSFDTPDEAADTDRFTTAVITKFGSPNVAYIALVAGIG